MTRFLEKLMTGAGVLCGAWPALAGPLTTNGNSSLPDYRRHPDDIIEVRIYGEDDLASKAKLNENGEVVLPLLPPLKVGGMTVQQANETVRAAYQRDFLINPVASLAIVEYGNSKVSVMGQVRNPGVYQFPANERLNLLQAIALAGGYTPIGQPSRVTIKRTIDGKTSVIHIDAKAMAVKEQTAIVEVFPNDVISVGETIF
jgi:polysaccharide export outer membrane protein